MSEDDVSAAKRAIGDGDSPALDQLLQDSKTLAGARDASGVSLILLALYHQKTSLAEQLLAACERPLDIFELAALGHVAALGDCLEASPDLANALSADGFSALGLAAFFGRPAAAKLLLKNGADVDRPSQNPMQVRPLHSAAANAEIASGLETARLLLDAGATPNCQQHGGISPLHQAAAGGKTELVKLLLERGASPALAAEDGRLAIDFSRRGNHPAASQLLLAAQ